MYIVDSAKFKKQIQKKGYKSLKDLAKAFSIHRNTLNHYLTGASVFPSKLSKLFDSLEIDPWSVIVKTVEEPKGYEDQIAEIVDRLSTEFPSWTFTLFGSRSRHDYTEYSDWDIGIFNKEGIEHSSYIRARIICKEWEEKLPFHIDLVNLANADREFLFTIRNDLQFLAGKRLGWNYLRSLIAHGNQ